MQETQETQVESLGQKDTLDEETATHSGILAREIPRTDKPRGHSLWGHTESDTVEHRALYHAGYFNPKLLIYAPPKTLLLV